MYKRNHSVLLVHLFWYHDTNTSRNHTIQLAMNLFGLDFKAFNKETNRCRNKLDFFCRKLLESTEQNKNDLYCYKQGTLQDIFSSHYTFKWFKWTLSLTTLQERSIQPYQNSTLQKNEYCLVEKIRTYSIRLRPWAINY